VASPFNNMANVLQSQGKLDDAMELYEEIHEDSGGFDLGTWLYADHRFGMRLAVLLYYWCSRFQSE
jgi:pentatricopeptide repeat protein